MDVMESFSKAIEKVLSRYSQSEKREVEIEEIWVDTSLPKDLIVELISEGKVSVPDGIEIVRMGKKIIWRRG